MYGSLHHVCITADVGWPAQHIVQRLGTEAGSELSGDCFSALGCLVIDDKPVEQTSSYTFMAFTIQSCIIQARQERGHGYCLGKG